MIRCVACRMDNPGAMRFCGGCGAALVATPAAGAERRQVTVVFCDLVGSTALSRRVDPEDLAAIILAYREACAAEVTRFGGRVTRYVGDGIVICFGYPTAHEDDAVNAVRCAAALVARVGALDVARHAPPGWSPAAHIGVHTGLVMIGELGSGDAAESAAIVGETPNVAARIEQVAPPHRVVMSAETHRLVAHRLECRSLGPIALDGAGDAALLYEFVGVRDAVGELRARLGEIRPQLGRDAEAALLEQRWALALRGEGQVGVIVGEPGMGKSRLLQTFAARRAQEGVRVLACLCQRETAGSVFHAMAVLIKGELGIGEREPEARVATLLAPIVDPTTDPARLVVPLAALLGGAEPDAAADAASRGELFDALTAWFLRLADEGPLLLVVEDAQWADPSTLEFLDRVARDAAGSRFMLLAAARLGFAPPWSTRSHAFAIQLGRLPAAAVHAMIQGLAGARSPPEPLIEHVVAKSDGVPLFVEEMTRMVLELPEVVDRGGQLTLTEAMPKLRVPSTLQESLLARLDRLGEAKAVAQAAAVLGTEFPQSMIIAFCSGPPASTEAALRDLVDAEIFLRRGAGPRAVYAFRHALLHDAAYESILISRRVELHRRAAALLTERFGDGAQRHPELVAQHWARGREPAQAIAWWRRAAQRANARSGFHEAAAFVRAALAELPQLPSGAERDAAEFGLQADLGVAMIAMRGEASPEVEQAYGRALALIGRLGDDARLFPVIRGLQTFYQVRGPLASSRQLAERLLRLSAGAGRVKRVEARRRLGWCLFCLGRLGDGRKLLEEAIALYDPGRAEQHIVQHSVDPVVLGRVNLAWLLAFAGDVAGATTQADTAIAYARRLGHALSLAYALGMAASTFGTLGEHPRAAALAREAVALASERRIAYWKAVGTLVGGWARARDGDSTGIADVDAGLAAYENSGARLFLPYGLGLRAELLAGAGRVDEAAAAVQRAIAIAEEIEARFNLADLRRAAVALALRRGESRDLCRDRLRDAIALADAMGARLVAARALALGVEEGLIAAGEVAALSPATAAWLRDAAAGGRIADLAALRAAIADTG